VTRNGSDDPWRIYLVVGVVGAIAIGAGLILVRERTSASNLAFVFLLWTIVVAELGGRMAALATALTSALSLNFFLTRPYLSIVIDERDDIIAFVALGVCGLVAAAFGQRRQTATVTLRDVRSDLDIIDRVSRILEDDRGLADRIARALDELRQSLPLQSVVVRAADGRVLAAADPHDLRSLEKAPQDLDPVTLLATGASAHRFGERGLRLPAAGGRIPLRSHGVLVGMLDLWEGDPVGFDQEQYRALSVVARLIGAELSASRRP
jgi:K+-sensing histidine kinase KdpD